MTVGEEFTREQPQPGDAKATNLKNIESTSGSFWAHTRGLLSTIALLGIGGILGIVLMFQTGRYQGRSETLRERDQHVNTYLSMVTSGYTNSMLNALLEQLPEDIRIVESGFGASSVWEKTSPSDFLMEQTWRFRVRSVESAESAEIIAAAVKKVLGRVPNTLRGISFQIKDVTAQKSGQVSVNFQWVFRTHDFSVRTSTESVFRDALVWCGLVNPPTTQWIDH